MKQHENLKHVLGVLSFVILIICLIQVFSHKLSFKDYEMFYAITFFSALFTTVECVDLYKLYSKKRKNTNNTIKG